jgi:FMN phosphatase YigB (HAD superfamily)
MAGFLGERQIINFVTDCDYTWYGKTPALDSKIWDSVEEAQVRFLLGLNDLTENDYPAFKKRFHELGGKKGYFQAFLELGGNAQDFQKFVQGVDTSQYLAYDATLAIVIELLFQQANIFIYSGSPQNSIEKVINTLIHQERSKLVTGIIGKEFLDQHGLQKTDKLAYELMLKELGLKPTETVMIDDLNRSLLVAREVGLATVHINPEQPLQVNGNEFSLPAFRQIFQILKFS